MSPANTPDQGFLSRGSLRSTSLSGPRFLLQALALTLLASALDQLAAPILHSSSPLWATTACLLLVWRRDRIPLSPGDPSFQLSISTRRLTGFLGAHGALILSARWLSSALQTAPGALTVTGTLLAAWKLCVLAPTIILFSAAAWKKIARAYSPEGIAGLVVLVTFFPNRALSAFWPWYGQALGRFVYTLARVFVPGLAYLGNSNPTLDGADLGVTIVPDCSGINGLELFDYLFGIVAFFDWNRLRKSRALVAYCAGLLTILLGNAIRITSFVVLGNHGFAESVSRFHIPAGWIFFSAVFLVYLSLTYHWILDRERSATRNQRSASSNL